MNNNRKIALKILALAATLLVGGSALAQSAKQMSFALGFREIKFKVKSGFLTAPTAPGVQNDVRPDTQPNLTINYMLTDNIGFEGYLAPAYKHDISGAGSIQGTGKLASIESLPATAVLQYRFFTPTTKMRPFVGIGVTYGYVPKERGSPQLTAISNTGSPTPTTFKVENNFGSYFQVGTRYSVNDTWFVTADLTKSYIKNTTFFSTGNTIDLKLDPVSYSLSVGRHF
jgi:outer membrane protein